MGVYRSEILNGMPHDDASLIRVVPSLQGRQWRERAPRTKSDVFGEGVCEPIDEVIFFFWIVSEEMRSAVKQIGRPEAG